MLKGISGKIIVLFVSLTAFSVLIAGGVMVYLFSDSLYSGEKNKMISCAEDFARLISVTAEEKGTLENAAASLKESAAEIIPYDFWLFESDGRLLAKTHPCPTGISLFGGEKSLQIQNALTGKTIISNEFSDLFDENTLSVLMPIDKNNFNPKDFSGSYSQKDVTGIIGVIILHVPVSELTAPLAGALWIMAGIFIFCIVLSLLIGYFFSKKFTRPLSEMREFAAQMTRGNFSERLEIRDSSELADLSVSLNTLSATTDRAFTKLENEQAKLNNIIDNISDGLAFFNTDMRLIKYNSALLRICGDDYFQKTEIREAMLEVLQLGESKTLVIEEKYILKFMISRIQTKNEVEGVLVIVSDISESERLNRMQNEFVANVSHEFRTPLTIIRASTEALLDGVVTDEESRMDCYEKIETETTALERLVKDLLDTSKLRAGKMPMHLEEMEAEPLIEKIVENMRMIAEEKNIHINYTPTVLPPLMADYDRLRQLLIIFLDNAIKFTPESGTITVSAYAKDNMAYLCVTDTGVGMSEEDIPYIFERFYKVDKARGGSKTGTGLGLAIAWQIAELHGGTIFVESKLGKGTTFKTLSPLAHPEILED